MSDSTVKTQSEGLIQSIGMPFLPKNGVSNDPGEWSFQFDPSNPKILKMKVNVSILAPIRLEFISEMTSDEVTEINKWFATVAAQMPSDDDSGSSSGSQSGRNRR